MRDNGGKIEILWEADQVKVMPLIGTMYTNSSSPLHQTEEFTRNDRILILSNWLYFIYCWVKITFHFHISQEKLKIDYVN